MNYKKVKTLIEELEKYESELCELQHTPIIKLFSQRSRNNNECIYSWGTTGTFEGETAPHAEALTLYVKKRLQKAINEIKDDISKYS